MATTRTREVPPLVEPGWGQGQDRAALAALVYLTLDVPTRPIRRVVSWTALAVVALLLLIILLATAVARRGGSEDVGGCVTDLAGPAATGNQTGTATAEQRANAGIVVNTGHQMGVPDRGVWVALAVALAESGLRNLPGGDRDSLGLFQQRPSQGWGTAAQIADPAYAAGQFFRRLLTIPGWESMPLAGAAQAVQRSAFPDAYNRWANLAATLLDSAGGTAPAACQPQDMATSVQVGAVLATARAQLGKPYVWGATGPNSYDCSGLTLTAWKAAGVTLPATSAAQASAGIRIPLTQLQPGDLLFWSVNGQVSGVHHVALYIGNGQILEAPETGIPVRVRPVHLAGPSGVGERELLPFGIRPASQTPPA